MGLESFYGMMVCTPSRGALMTGRYPMCYGLQTLVIFPSHTYGLATDERTLPQALKEAGYYTAIIGKWHLGHARPEVLPRTGASTTSTATWWAKWTTSPKTGAASSTGSATANSSRKTDYTDLIGDDAVKLIENMTARSLVPLLASLVPHAPYQAPAVHRPPQRHHQRRKMQNLRRHDNGHGYRDRPDVAAVEKKKMLGNTLIFFATDNGGSTSALFATRGRSPRGAGGQRRPGP